MPCITLAAQCTGPHSTSDKIVALSFWIYRQK